MKYEERIIAFIDILGFKKHVDATIDKNGNDNEEKINEIIKIYDTIKGIWNHAKKGNIGSKKVSIFSDSIVISYKVNDKKDNFEDILLEIKSLIMELIFEKYLCRGAITVGKLLHTNDYLFGPALNEAYLLETKAATYPRIILDRPIIEAGLEYTSSRTSDMRIDYFLGQDSDGMYYLDYFLTSDIMMQTPSDFLDYVKHLGEIIRSGLKASSHYSKADLRAKYAWMREKYNYMIDIIHNNKDWEHDYLHNDHKNLLKSFKEIKKISPNKYKKVPFSK